MRYRALKQHLGVFLSLLLLFAAFSIPSPVTALTRTQGGEPRTQQLAAPQQLDLMNGLYRRAVEMLESARGSKLAPDWDQAWLGTPVPLYRPDVKGPAYYEFPVDVTLPQIGNVGSASAVSHTGFIILSTGPHDFPIAHWNFTGKSPTQVLRDTALPGSVATKFYKLDALSYAAEDSAGNLLSNLGTPLAKVGGTDPAWLGKPQPLSTFIYTPTLNAPDNQSVGGGISSTVGPLTSSLNLGGWPAWSELKAGFNSSYGVLIAALAQQAAADWDTLSLLDQYGEGLRKGQTYLLPALETLAGWSPAGSGAPHVTITEQKRTGLPSLLQIHVDSSIPSAELPLSVTLDYGGALSETVRFTIIDPPPLQKAYMPVVANASAAAASNASTTSSADLRNVSMAQVEASPKAPADTWGPWNYYWAGSHADQRLYTQIDQSENPPNNTGCPSGCGATAWAMLFGWADYQAAIGNPYWAPRNGLYRQNGGYGADAVAPAVRDSGVTNMTWEIRSRIGTWCVFGSAPTLPWNMGNAAGYFVGRTGTHMVTHYNVLGIHEDGIRDAAANSIIYRHTPAVIGTGWLNHYPLAYGFAWQLHTVRHCFIVCWTDTDYNRAFYVNQGWGGAGNGWISAGTWFDGEIYP